MIPIINAAGTVKLVEQAWPFQGSLVNKLVLGSYTSEPRTGNEGHVFEPPLNALGLPNPGIDYLVDHYEKFAGIRGDDEEIIVSVAPFSIPDLRKMLRKIKHVAMIEINLGCPNVDHAIMSFDPPFVRSALTTARQETKAEIGLKLSPYSDPRLLGKVAEVLTDPFEPPDFLTLSNTFPNGWLPGWGERGPTYGGVSGPGVKPIVLGQIHQFRQLVGPDMWIYGAGGFSHGHDLADYEAAGANGVQVATRYLVSGENPGVFGDILLEMQ